MIAVPASEDIFDALEGFSNASFKVIPGASPC